jgi:hypothetical protein
MQLPNLGALNLRQRTAKTGTNPDSGQNKRQKTSGAQNAEVAARGVQIFIDGLLNEYFGRTPTEQEKRDLLERVKREVLRLPEYANQGLTLDWPDEVGATQGQGLLQGKPPGVRGIRRLKIEMWSDGFASLKRQQVDARKDEDRKRKQAMLERELRDKDSDEGRDYFDSMSPETPESPDALLKDDMRKKAEGKEPQRWGEDLQNFDHDDGCCAQR